MARRVSGAGGAKTATRSLTGHRVHAPGADKRLDGVLDLDEARCAETASVYVHRTVAYSMIIDQRCGNRRDLTRVGTAFEPRGPLIINRSADLFA